MLPLGGLTHSPEDGFSARSSSLRLPVIFRRLHRFQQMDFELAAWQLTYLCLAPRRVYRNVYFHKQTKNTWARDDPAILVLITTCLTVAAIAWGIVYSYGPVGILNIALLMILRDFLLTGIVIATVLWSVFIQMAGRKQSNLTFDLPTCRVEWGYAFDVHTNAFFPLFLALYLAQLFLLPIITKSNWVCLWVGNTLYLAAFTQYIYGLYLGFNALPFLVRSELLLAPLLPLLTAYIASLLGFNVPQHVLGAYFR